MRRGLEFGLIVLLSFALSGCGAGKPCSVSGKVKYAGEAVKTGSLRFDPVGDTPGEVGKAQITNGEYKIPRDAGMKAGKFLVSIYATRETGKSVTPAEKLEGGSGGPMKEVVQYIPSKYNTKSTLTVELQADENSKDFELQAATD